MIDDGHAIHYSAVEPGTPVYGADGVQVGTVVEVVDNYKEHILDGFVVRMNDGEFRFVDGPEVKRTAERGVTLTITAEEAVKLPRPDRGTPTFRPRRASRLGRFLGGGWKRDR